VARANALEPANAGQFDTVRPLAEPRMTARGLGEVSSPDTIQRWDALATRTGEPNPFFESWYLLPALKNLDPTGKVRLLVLEMDDEWLGLIPISLDSRYYTYPLPQLCSWIHGNCFLGLPLIAKGHEVVFWQALLGWADNNAAYGLFLHLSHLPLKSQAYEVLRSLLAETGRHAALVHSEERALLASAMTAEEYWEASLSGKKRKELRRQRNRLAELGEVSIDQTRDATDLADWTESFLKLEAAGWKGSAGSALASAPAKQNLFREALAGAAARGKLERATITLDGEPIAMLASFIASAGSFSFKTAFDEAYSRFSPGVLLQQANLALLDDPEFTWCDSCASADHPMIDHIWRERRSIGRLSIAIGGIARRTLFAGLAYLESGFKSGAAEP
jgi:CelD/BcsL family acetyltransferase involved in cellulose biosynthesis